MKKLTKLFAIALLSVMAITLVACGGAPSFAKNPDSNPDKLVKTLEDKGFEADKMETDDLSFLDIDADAEGVECVVMGMKMDPDLSDISDLDELKKIKKITMEVIVVVYFDTADNAKTFFKEAKSELKKAMDDELDSPGMKDVKVSSDVSQSGKTVTLYVKATAKLDMDF